MALFLSSIFRTADSASSAGLALLILWFIGLPIGAGLLYGSAEPSLAVWQTVFAWLPVLNTPMMYYVMITNLVSAGTGPTATGMRWEQRTDNLLARYIDSEGVVSTSYFSYEMCMTYQVLSFFLHFVCAMYLEKVVPNSYGKRGSLCCCITRFLGGKRAGTKNNARADIEVDGIKKHTDDAEVVAEASLVKQGWAGADQRNVAMEVIGLTKTFHGGALRAVDGIAYGVDKDSLFVLLGHNGAGKTTTINMLVGNMTHNGGDALVFGNSISDDMSTVNKIMGVCPQHDVLYHRLTGAEHLRLFATMKSSSGSLAGMDVEQEVTQRLADVNLVASQNVNAGAYSGGMQRRLSIAIALIGDPKIVYLDEPTTGMDPVTRRSVWDMIQKAKVGRVIMLTTHSMEEADILGDRVAVMSHGHIQALGTPLALKRKFGVGFSMTVFLDKTNPNAAADTIALFKGEIPSIEVNKQVDQAIKFKVPIADDDPKLVPFFKTLEENKERCGIKDFSVGLATLEEVFLELSRRDLLSADDYFQLQFAIPEGATPGAQLAMPLPDGSTHTFVVGADQKPGDQVDMRVPKPKKASDAVAIDAANSAAAAAAAAPSPKRDRSFKNTCTALTEKTCTLTRRKYGVLCGNMCFPIVILLLIILLNGLLDSFRYSAICGKDIKDKETCRKKGYNMTCITNIREQTAPPSGFGLMIGQPLRGWGLDRNCGDDAGGVYDDTGNGNNGTLCYTKLEKPSFNLEYSAEKKSSSSNKQMELDLGHIKYTSSADLNTWYENFRFELTSSFCDEIVSSLLDCDDQCGGVSSGGGGGRPGRASKIDRGAKIRENYIGQGFDYGFDEDDKTKCEDQCRNLTLADSYRRVDDGQPLSDDFFASCLKKDDDRRRRLQTGKERSGENELDRPTMRAAFRRLNAKRRRLNDANFWTPLNATRDVVEAIYDLKKTCEIGWMHNVSRWFLAKDVADPVKTTGTFDFRDSVAKAVASRSGSGFLGGYTTRSMVDDGFVSFWNAFMRETKVDMLISSQLQGLRLMYMGHTGMDMMAASCKRLLLQKVQANARIAAANMTTTIEALCDYVGNIDAVRNLQFTEASTTTKLHDNLFKRHTDFSTGEVSTAYMKSRNKYYVGYKQHYYTSDVLAFEFEDVDLDKGTSEYVAYWNFSGSSSQPFPVMRAPQTHWNHLIAMADSMFVYNLTGGAKRLGSVTKQTFPVKFDCNAEEFIYDDTGTVKLDCAPLLGFLNFNLADYIAGIMMMFFFWAPIYGIVQGVVYEKQYRLRVIMQMMGLTSNVYWLVTYVLEVLKYTATLTVVFIVGRMLGLNYFTNHNQLVLWFFMFVWANLIVTFGFFLAALFKSTKTSGAVTFLILMMFLTSVRF
jgi:ABC-type multidrug transport system ATPase subunit